MPSAKKKLNAMAKARDRAFQNAKNVEAATRRAWSCARHAPVFCKKGTRGVAKNKLRANPLISAHAFQIALAGAGMHVQKEIQAEASQLRCKLLPESKNTPFLPQVASGAVVMIEQFICAIVQTGIRNAGIIRNAHGRKKISFADAMRGMDVALRDINGTNQEIVPLTLPLRKKAKKAVSKHTTEHADKDQTSVPQENTGEPAVEVNKDKDDESDE